MASRMERYYKAEERSKKNQNLYDQISDIKDVKEYSNIEGIVDISNSSEININTIKEWLNINDDSNDNKLHYVESNESTSELSEEEENNYDIKEVLSKAKTMHNDKDIKHRNLKIHQYKLLKKLKEEHPDNEEIDELLNTLAFTNGSNDDLGIFDDLKSDTMVGEEASSIKKVLDEAKDIEENGLNEVEVEEEHTNLDDLDKSFYTGSFNFSNRDFDDLKNLNKNIKKNNKLIKIFLIVFSVSVAIVLLVLVAKLIF